MTKQATVSVSSTYILCNFYIAKYFRTNELPLCKKKHTVIDDQYILFAEFSRKDKILRLSKLLQTRSSCLAPHLALDGTKMQYSQLGHYKVDGNCINIANVVGIKLGKNECVTMPGFLRA